MRSKAAGVHGAVLELLGKAVVLLLGRAVGSHDALDQVDQLLPTQVTGGMARIVPGNMPCCGR